jgi:hypothetical protein
VDNTNITVAWLKLRSLLCWSDGGNAAGSIEYRE